MKRNILTTLWFILICPLSLLAQSPWQQHGKLEVSKNGHMIRHKDGSPFLWIGDRGWGRLITTWITVKNWDLL